MDGQVDTNIAQWAKAAQQRSRKAILYALARNRRAKQIFCDTEDRMEHTAEEYRRALLLGAALPPMSTVEITVEVVQLEPKADQPDCFYDNQGQVLEPPSR